MDEKVAIVTGGTKGIGYHVVKGLCERLGEGWVVYATARDEERGQEAVEELQAALKENQHSGRPVFYQLDISDEEAVQEFAKIIKEKHVNVDILVNNAGMAYSQDAKEPFATQVHETMKTNFWGTLYVCEAFKPLLGPHARVVNVSSIAGELRRIDGDEPKATELRRKFAAEDLTMHQLKLLIQEFEKLSSKSDDAIKKAGWPTAAYSVSKVGVSAMSRVLQREVAGNASTPTDIVVNYVHPGHIPTETSNYTGEKPPEKGASPIIFAALLPPQTHIRGEFIWEDGTVSDWVYGHGQKGGFSYTKEPHNKHTKGPRDLDEENKEILEKQQAH